MENVSRALIMVFSMLMFVIGFSYSMYLLNKLIATSDNLLESVATTGYYDNIEVKDSNVGSRTVGIDTIIPTLYRYYKENYIVMIYDGPELLQRFDIDLETQIARAAAIDPSATADTAEKKRMKSLNESLYNKKIDSGKRVKAYLFEAPWTGNVENDTRARIDYFLNGTKGYINNTEVDYKIFGASSNQSFVEAYKDAKFTEEFVEYTYKGDTISTDEGVETITGSTQESSKIIITYTKK